MQPAVHLLSHEPTPETCIAGNESNPVTGYVGVPEAREAVEAPEGSPLYSSKCPQDLLASTCVDVWFTTGGLVR